MRCTGVNLKQNSELILLLAEQDSFPLPFFSLQPKGKYVIGVCLGTACYVKGAGQILDKFSEIIGIKPGETSADGLFTLDALRCIGACGIAPAVTINGKVYPKLTVDAVPKIVDEYKAMEANDQ